MQEVERKIPCGRIRGYEENGICFFKGIRYANTRRFEKAQEVKRWEGVFDAVHDGADCFQRSSFLSEAEQRKDFYYCEFYNGENFTYTEDYVTLNIIAPKEAKNCPVFVFIHGGGHETGKVSELPYGTSTAYAKKGIVYVSVGYRLNVFSMYQCKNLGLSDVLCALSWLKRNIGAFGGDSERMTLGGQSAGAMMLSDLCLSDLAKPYIKGAVLMSGGGAIPSFAAAATKEQAADYWNAVRTEAGAANDEELKRVPPQVLWEAWSRVKKRMEKLPLIQPGIDGEIIKMPQAQELKNGYQLKIPYMIGVTSQDFMPVILYEIARKWARASQKPVYGYFFDRNVPGDSYKAWHAADLWYAFGNMENSRRPFEEVDYRLSETMISYISNFVKKGNPNGGQLSRWEPLSKKQKGFRLLDGCSDGYASPLYCRRKLWHTFLFEHGPM